MMLACSDNPFPFPVCAQVSLEMDDESEDEVEALAEMYDPDCSNDGTFRFALLRELWASAR